ncbi:unnamed protein product [Zymoseptoria tritici ST99CH_1E4]|uniref:Glutaminase A n=1 Tax=Zymoseptoria tritici ST99CH_1E4 TaxID=1276532 RepID=A0A2H1FIZ5_ZYMTR|nr:unnamed protein product [Zymoseptoria tritici ST99CH_1E4]
MWAPYLLSSLPLLASLVTAESTFSPARPPAIPLAVKTPYLSTWQKAGSIDGGNGGYLAGEWPTFWAGAIVGWCGLIKVDGQTYTWMGKPDNMPPVVDQTSFEYTSTRSTFTMNAGPVNMTVEFFSPVDVQDKTRYSNPVSYMTVSTKSSDGNEHNVSIYTDVSGEWASGDRSKVVQWEQGAQNGQGGLVYHKFYRQEQQEFSEDSDQAAWGNWYYATEQGQGLTYQTGPHIATRQQWIDRGELTNQVGTNYRAISDNFPIFAFAKNLGRVGGDQVDTTFTINLLQRNVVQYNPGNGLRPVQAMWSNFHQDEVSAINAFYHDRQQAQDVGNSLHDKIVSDSKAAAGNDYVIATTLALRQAFAAVQLGGTADTNHLYIKEISSNGNFQTVDVIFPFIPILFYLNPSWVPLILDPLYINMESPGAWPQKYAIHDLGDHYPNATGHSNGKAAEQPLEECGNMLIMTLAYAQKTGDTAYLSSHYTLLSQWANWLIDNNAVLPFNQISTDDFAGKLANQTNLALKGIIGLEAASLIASMTGHPNDAQRYTSTAHDWIQQWASLALNTQANPPHTTLDYGAPESFSLLYNLYADRLLSTNLVPQYIYDIQSNFYPSVRQTYGVPLDTRSTRSKNDWEMFCAAIASDQTKQMFVSDLAKFINETPSSAPVTDLFEVGNGTQNGNFRARPVVGGWYALLALNGTTSPQGQGMIGQRRNCKLS